jgi:hypothetical protein
MYQQHAEFHDVHYPEDHRMDTITREAAPPAGPTVTLRTPHDHKLVIDALEARAEALDKLAKKNEDEHYTREARAINADVAAINTTIIPAFRGQASLKLVADGELQAAVARAIKPKVHRALVQYTTSLEATEDKDDQRDLLVDREQGLLEELARHVELMLLAASAEGVAAGVAMRESDPEVVAVRALGTLREDL